MIGDGQIGHSTIEIPLFIIDENSVQFVFCPELVTFKFMHIAELLLSALHYRKRSMGDMKVFPINPLHFILCCQVDQLSIGQFSCPLLSMSFPGCSKLYNKYMERDFMNVLQ